MTIVVFAIAFLLALVCLCLFMAFNPGVIHV